MTGAATTLSLILLGIDNATRKPLCGTMDRRARQSALTGRNRRWSGAARPVDRRGARGHSWARPLMPAFDGRLPYLFKILDVRKMLSIQAHPTLLQAKAGLCARKRRRHTALTRAAETTKTTITNRKLAWRSPISGCCTVFGRWSRLPKRSTARSGAGSADAGVLPTADSCRPRSRDTARLAAGTLQQRYDHAPGAGGPAAQ